jgi:hypothetical protein
MIVLALGLGWSAAARVSACAQIAQEASASDDGCKTCGDAGAQAEQGCFAVSCAGPCASNAMPSSVDRASIQAPLSARLARPLPAADGARMRPIPPDPPPPR